MTEEEKKDTTPEEKPEVDAEAPESEKDEGTEDEKALDTTIDYKAELEKERQAREKAEKALAGDRFKKSKEKREVVEEESEEDEEQPLTPSQLEARLAQERQQTEKIFLAREANQIAGQMAGSEDEKALILEVFKNRSFPSHLSLQEQIEEAYLIANRKKIVGENSELKRALLGKAGVNTDTATTHHDESKGTEPKIAPQDAKAIKEAGFAWNTTSRRYEKKLKNGQILIQDPKTKQTYIAGVQRSPSGS